MEKPKLVAVEFEDGHFQIAVERRSALGSVEIQDSRGSLFVIQASDGTIRFD
jgi:hypothetical protein